MGSSLLLLLLLTAAGVVALLMTVVVVAVGLRARRGEVPAKTPSSAARVDARPLPAERTTCPFCHDEVAAGDGVVCARCLARQHETCWDEGGACGACRHAERHGRAERARA